MLNNEEIRGAMTIQLGNEYPDYPEFQEGIRRAPDRGFRLTKAQTRIALKNALRYVPEELHEKLAPEFMEELTTYGRIYAYRYRPQGRIYGKPIDEYKGKCLAGKAFQVMIDNNLDFEVALYPYELVTYGETGSVCQNWLQYRLIKKYLEELTDDLTLVVESGHPLGLFPSKPDAPRVIITNAMMIGMYDNLDDWEIAEEMGVANYGQMTAGGWMYIGPQGIVHGTFNTILNAGRKELGVPQDGDLTGHTFVSSGLGGMSGAQPKAANIANAVGIFAEVDLSRIETRHDQGWVDVIEDDLDKVFALANEKLAAKETCRNALGFGPAFDAITEKTLSEQLRELVPQDLIKFGLTPEFIGRLPVFVVLDELDEEALVRILTEPRNSLVKQYQKLMEPDGVDLVFESEALREIARIAMRKNTGARGLRAIMENVMEDIMFDLPDENNVTKCIITKAAVLGEDQPVYVREDYFRSA